MGKQQRKKTQNVPPPRSANSVDWEIRARELYLQGLISLGALTRPWSQRETELTHYWRETHD